MLNSIILGADTEAGAYLRQVCADFTDICVYKGLNRNARLHEVIVVLNSYEPDVVFLDVSDLEFPNSVTSASIRELLMKHPQVAIVPFCGRPGSTSLADPNLSALGPILTPPFSAEKLELVVRGALRLRRIASKRESTILAFLPSKPGAGATTVALHVAAAAALIFHKRTLLIEADLRSGSIAYQLGIHTDSPAIDAIDDPQISDAQWRRCVDQNYGFDIIPASGGPHPMQGSRWDYYKLLRFARNRYDVIVVDLPEAIDEITESIFAEADRYVMIAAPEIASLSMVRRRVLEMENLGVAHNRMQLAVNRYLAGDGEPPSMAELAKRAITAVLPDDPQAIKSANRRRELALGNSGFWTAVVSLTSDLLGLGKTDATPSSFRFLRKTIGSLFGSSSPHTLHDTAPTRGKRII